jgi:hypothetical protein
MPSYFSQHEMFQLILLRLAAEIEGHSIIAPAIIFASIYCQIDACIIYCITLPPLLLSLSQLLLMRIRPAG